MTIYRLPSNGAIIQCGLKAHAVKAGRTTRVQQIGLKPTPHETHGNLHLGRPPQHRLILPHQIITPIGHPRATLLQSAHPVPQLQVLKGYQPRSKTTKHNVLTSSSHFSNSEKTSAIATAVNPRQVSATSGTGLTSRCLITKPRAIISSWKWVDSTFLYLSLQTVIALVAFQQFATPSSTQSIRWVHILSYLCSSDHTKTSQITHEQQKHKDNHSPRHRHYSTCLHNYLPNHRVHSPPSDALHIEHKAAV